MVDNESVLEIDECGDVGVCAGADVDAYCDVVKLGDEQS